MKPFIIATALGKPIEMTELNAVITALFEPLLNTAAPLPNTFQICKIEEVNLFP
jgi:hypothetical protein